MMQLPGRSVARQSQTRRRKSLMIATLEQTQGMQRADSGTVVASLEGISKNYGEVRALRNVNFSVHAGQVVALLGPNGAGKTTAVKLLLGLIQPDSGKVRVFN